MPRKTDILAEEASVSSPLRRSARRASVNSQTTNESKDEKSEPAPRGRRASTTKEDPEEKPEPARTRGRRSSVEPTNEEEPKLQAVTRRRRSSAAEDPVDPETVKPVRGRRSSAAEKPIEEETPKKTTRTRGSTKEKDIKEEPVKRTTRSRRSSVDKSEETEVTEKTTTRGRKSSTDEHENDPDVKVKLTPLKSRRRPSVTENAVNLEPIDEIETEVVTKRNINSSGDKKKEGTENKPTTRGRRSSTDESEKELELQIKLTPMKKRRPSVTDNVVNLEPIEESESEVKSRKSISPKHKEVSVPSTPLTQTAKPVEVKENLNLSVILETSNLEEKGDGKPESVTPRRSPRLNNSASAEKSSSPLMEKTEIKSTVAEIVKKKQSIFSPPNSNGSSPTHEEKTANFNISQGSDGSFNFHLDMPVSVSTTEDIEEKEDLNSSKSSNASDKENMDSNKVPTPSAKKSGVKEGKENDPPTVASVQPRVSDVFRPKMNDYSFVEPMDVDEYPSTLNCSEMEKSKSDNKKLVNKNLKRDSLAPGEGDSVDESFYLCLSIEESKSEEFSDTSKELQEKTAKENVSTTKETQQGIDSVEDTVSDQKEIKIEETDVELSQNETFITVSEKSVDVSSSSQEIVKSEIKQSTELQNQEISGKPSSSVTQSKKSCPSEDYDFHVPSDEEQAEQTCLIDKTVESHVSTDSSASIEMQTVIVSRMTKDKYECETTSEEEKNSETEPTLDNPKEDKGKTDQRNEDHVRSVRESIVTQEDDEYEDVFVDEEEIADKDAGESFVASEDEDMLLNEENKSGSEKKDKVVENCPKQNDTEAYTTEDKSIPESVVTNKDAKDVSVNEQEAAKIERNVQETGKNSSKRIDNVAEDISSESADTNEEEMANFENEKQKVDQMSRTNVTKGKEEVVEREDKSDTSTASNGALSENEEIADECEKERMYENLPNLVSKENEDTGNGDNLNNSVVTSHSEVNEKIKEVLKKDEKQATEKNSPNSITKGNEELEVIRPDESSICKKIDTDDSTETEVLVKNKDESIATVNIQEEEEKSNSIHVCKETEDTFDDKEESDCLELDKPEKKMETKEYSFEDEDKHPKNMDTEESEKIEDAVENKDEYIDTVKVPEKEEKISSVQVGEETEDALDDKEKTTLKLDIPKKNLEMEEYPLEEYFGENNEYNSFKLVAEEHADSFEKEEKLIDLDNSKIKAENEDVPNSEVRNSKKKLKGRRCSLTKPIDNEEDDTEVYRSKMVQKSKKKNKGGNLVCEDNAEESNLSEGDKGREIESCKKKSKSKNLKRRSKENVEDVIPPKKIRKSVELVEESPDDSEEVKINKTNNRKKKKSIEKSLSTGDMKEDLISEKRQSKKQKKPKSKSQVAVPADNGGNDVNIKETGLKKSPSDILDEYLTRKVAEMVNNGYSSEGNEDNDDSREPNDFLYTMAEEGEEDTPSEDSNEIIDEGEYIGYTDSERDSEDEYDEDDSFICDDEDERLLSGEEYDLGERKTKKKKRKSRIIQLDNYDDDDDVIKIQKKEKLVSKKMKSRIISITDSSESDENEGEGVDRHNQNEEKSKKTYVIVNDSKDSVTKSLEEETGSLVESKSASVVTILDLSTLEPTEVDSDKDTDTENATFSDKVNKSEEVIVIEEKKRGHADIREDASSSNVSPQKRQEKKRLSTLKIHENIDVREIKDSPISGRVVNILDSFCNNIHKGEISMNLSIECSTKDGDSEEEFAEKKISTKARILSESIRDDSVIVEEAVKSTQLPKMISCMESTDSEKESRRKRKLCKSKEHLDQTEPKIKKRKARRRKKKHVEETNLRRSALEDELRAKSSSLINQLITDVRNRPRRTVKPSTHMDMSWITEIVDVKPSTSAFDKHEKEAYKAGKIHPKDFRSQMLNDPKRVRRIETKTLLKKKGV